jgi:hypothetical protein
MKWLRGAAVTITAVGMLGVVGCGQSTTPSTEETPTSEASTPQTAPDEPGSVVPKSPASRQSRKPGVPDSPIDYDNTRTGFNISPAQARAAVEQDLRTKCGPGRCQVTVTTTGRGDCVKSIGPRPVYPGGKVTVVAMGCTPPDESPDPDETTTTAETTRTSDG